MKPQAGLTLGIPAGLPLLVSIISAKGNAAVFVVLCLMAALLHLWPRPRKPRAPGCAMTVVLVLFCLWAGASAVWALDPSADFLGAARLTFMMAGGLLLWSAARSLDLDQARQFRYAYLLLYLMGLAVILVDQLSGNALMVAYTSMKDKVAIPAGFSFQPFIKHRAVVLALGLWPAFLTMREERGTKAALLLAAIVAGLVASHQSEAALAAILLGTLMVVLTWKAPRLALAGGVAVLLLVFILPPFLHGNMPTPREIARAHPGLPHSLLHRLLIWDYALEKIAQKPVLGYGFDAAREIGGREPKRHFDFDPEPGRPLYRPFFEPIPLHTHNGVIQLWLELGGVGAGLGFALLVLVWRSALKESDPWRRAAQGAFLAAMMSPVLLSYGLFQAWWVGTLWILAAALGAGKRA